MIHRFGYLLPVIILLLSANSLLAQWAQMGTGITGSFHTAWCLADSPGELFVGTPNNVLKSTDSGQTWRLTGLTNTRVYWLLKNGTTLIAGTDGFASNNPGLFRSSDDGATWQAINYSGWGTSVVYSMVMSEEIIFAGGVDGVFQSSDDGQTWTARNGGLQSVQVYSLSVMDSTLFAGGAVDTAGNDSGYVFRSTDEGISWSKVGSFPSGVSMLANNGSDLFAGTYSSGVFSSRDSGVTWAQMDNGLTNTEILSLVSNGNQVFAGTDGGGVFQSSDGGLTWKSFGLDSLHIEAFYESDSSLFAATGSRGVLRSSTSAPDWNQADTNWTGSTPIGSTSELLALGSNVYAFTNTGILSSTDNGTDWQTTSHTLNSVTATAGNDSIIFAGTSTNGVFRSLDHGKTWHPMNNGLTDTLVVALAISGENLFAATTPGFFLSTDNGATWTSADSGLAGATPICLCVTGRNLFLGTWSGLYRSTDNASSWSYLGKIPCQYLYCLASDGTDLFAGASDGVFVSGDYGTTWSKTSPIQQDVGAYSLATRGKNLLAGTWQGVYLSTDQGSNWTDVSYGLPPNSSVSCLAINDSSIFAGTYGGLWARPLYQVPTGIEQNDMQLPSQFSLLQNYPNPFNPSTTIEYKLPRNAFVVLKIFDVLGREVETLVNGRQNAGDHVAKFEGSDLPSGVYFFRLQAGTYTDTKKMVLLK